MALDHAKICWIICEKCNSHGRELLIYGCLRHGRVFCSPWVEIKLGCKEKVKQHLTATAHCLKLQSITWMLIWGGLRGEFSHPLLPTTLHHTLQWAQVKNIDSSICLIHAVTLIVIMRGKTQIMNKPQGVFQKVQSGTLSRVGVCCRPVWAEFFFPHLCCLSLHLCCYSITDTGSLRKWLGKQKSQMKGKYFFPVCIAWKVQLHDHHVLFHRARVD